MGYKQIYKEHMSQLFMLDPKEEHPELLLHNNLINSHSKGDMYFMYDVTFCNTPTWSRIN